MKGFPGGMQQFMRQINQTQSKIKKIQEELEDREFQASSGGGAVTAKVNGKQLLTDLTITKEVLDGGDTEMVQDLVLTAVNEALKESKDTADKEMEKATGGLSMPGLF